MTTTPMKLTDYELRELSDGRIAARTIPVLAGERLAFIKTLLNDVSKVRPFTDSGFCKFCEGCDDHLASCCYVRVCDAVRGLPAEGAGR